MFDDVPPNTDDINDDVEDEDNNELTPLSTDDPTEPKTLEVNELKELKAELDEPLVPEPGPRICACAAGCGRIRTRKSVALPVVPVELLLKSEPTGLEVPRTELPIELAEDGTPARILPLAPPKVDGIVCDVKAPTPAGGVNVEPLKPELVLDDVVKLKLLILDSHSLTDTIEHLLYHRQVLNGSHF